MSRRPALTDEDGIDGPLERRLARLDRPTRRRNPLTTSRDIPAVTLIELDEALAPARATETASRAANAHLAAAARAIAAGKPR